MNQVVKSSLLTFALALLSIATYAQTWVTVGSPGFSAGEAWYTSIVIDSAGMPYIVYKDSVNGLKATVMKYNGSSWSAVSGAGFSSGYVVDDLSMVLDRDGTLYVAYNDGSIGMLGAATVMKYDGSSWSVVGSPGFSLTYADWLHVAIDTAGTPYVVYMENGNKATVMKFNGSDWAVVGSPGFSDSTAFQTTIAIDVNGTPYVAYQDYSVGRKATVMKYNGTAWVPVGSKGFSAGVASSTSIALDSSGTPFVVYQDATTSIHGQATVMKFNGSSWVVVGAAGFSAGQVHSTSIALDGSGTPYVVFQDNGILGPVSVMKYDGSSWVGVGSPGFSDTTVAFTSIALDRSGMPYVTYADVGHNSKATVMRFGFPAEVKKVTQPSSIVFSPNPSHGSFTLHLSTPQKEEATIIITNMLGEKVKELTATTNTDTQIQLNVPPGVYFVSAITKEGRVNEKIIIE